MKGAKQVKAFDIDELIRNIDVSFFRIYTRTGQDDCRDEIFDVIVKLIINKENREMISEIKEDITSTILS